MGLTFCRLPGTMPSEANLMLHARKLGHASGVGLTAIMIVIAGLPQLACACPGKRAPSVPAAEGPADSTCACGRCCASTAKAQGTMSCCSGRQHAPTSSPRGALEQKSCKVSLVLSAMSVVPFSVKAGLSYEIPVPFSAIAVTPSDTSFRGANSAAWRDSHHAPPPDLLTLFQHFLI
jgi:hypothetical protein